MATGEHIKDIFGNRLKECPICHKKFYVMNSDYWTYKIGARYYCGWNHFSQAKYKTRGA